MLSLLSSNNIPRVDYLECLEEYCFLCVNFENAYLLQNWSKCTKNAYNVTQKLIIYGPKSMIFDIISLLA